MNIRKNYISFLRVLSVLLVTIFHFAGSIKSLSDVPSVFNGFANGNWGMLGVFLFFMISGNVLYTKYESKFHEKEFLKNRFLRLFPSFWFWYVVFFLINFWQRREFPEGSLWRFVFTLLGMDGYFLYKTETFYILGEWFLGAIIFLYLLFPIVRLAVKRNIHVTVGVLLVLTSLVYYNNFFGFFEISKGRNLITALFFFVYGIWIEKVINSIQSKYITRGITVLLAILSIVALFVGLPFDLPAYICIVSFLFCITMQAEELFKKWTGFMKFISSIDMNSYTVFLTHHIIIYKVTEHFSGVLMSLKGIVCIFIIDLLLIILSVSVEKFVMNNAKSARN